MLILWNVSNSQSEFGDGTGEKAFSLILISQKASDEVIVLQ